MILLWSVWGNEMKIKTKRLILRTPRLVKLKDLVEIYEYASKVSKDKPQQHKERFEKLKEIK